MGAIFFEDGVESCRTTVDRKRDPRSGELARLCSSRGFKSTRQQSITHITELLRNGASLVEARELARHSDIRMTMRYTHIGLDDQARAVAAIPAPRIPRPPLPDQNPWECAGSDSGGTPCHVPSSADNGVTMELATAQEENPCDNRGSGVVCPPLARIRPFSKLDGFELRAKNIAIDHLDGFTTYPSESASVTDNRLCGIE